jgi:hypothetical protein
MKVHNLVVTGSLQSGGENITSISSSVASTVVNVSSSLSNALNQTSASLRNIMATTGSNVFVGTQTISGSIVPAVNGAYDLGSSTHEFRHLYLSSASLYIDGTKVLGSTTQELQITTDNGQSFKILEAGSDTITLQAADGNITLATSGGGDVILDPTSGIIALKGTTTLYAGNKILSSDGNAIQIGNSATITGSLIVTGYIEAQELRTTYISSSILYRSGSTKFGDELTDTHAFTGSLLISGSVTAIGSNLISGSSQILNGSGILSGSGTESQIPIWGTGGTILSNSRITQPDSNNIRINHGDTYTLGARFTYGGTYLSELHLGRTNTGADSNVSMIYDIQGTEVFELRRNYAAASFKVSLGSTAHLTISNTGAATFNSTLTTGGNINLVANSGALVLTNTGASNKRWDISSSGNDLTINETGVAERVRITAGGSTVFANTVGIGLSTPQAILDVSHTGATTNIIRVSNGSGNYRWRVDQNFAMIMTNASGTDTFSVSTSGSISTPAQFTSFATAPLSFQGNGNTGTYTQTTIYANQNNTSGDVANGIFIERGYTDVSNTELRQFVIGARGGSYQWKLSGPGGTFQRDTCEVKPAGDGDLFVGRYSGGSAKVFRVYQASADGFLELQTGAGDVVTKLSGYGGTAGYTLTNFGIGISNPGYRLDVDGGSTTGAAFRATKQASQGDGLVAYFTNSSNGGYSSYIYIGSNPGTDWKIGKNISNPTNTTYHFEIVDSSNNVRMQINNSTGNVTFSGSVTQNSDITLKKNVRDIDGALGMILQTRGVLYDKIDETETNQIGFIAQELESILPELVVTNDIGVKSVKYQNMTPLLVEAIKELKLENDNLKDILRRNNLV